MVLAREDTDPFQFLADVRAFPTAGIDGFDAALPWRTDGGVAGPHHRRGKVWFGRMAGQVPAMTDSLAGQNNWRMHEWR